MGGNCCKGAVVTPAITTVQAKKQFENVEPSEQQDSNIQKLLPELVQPKLHRTAINRESSAKTKKSIEQLETTEIATSSDSEEALILQTSVVRPTFPSSNTYKKTIYNKNPRPTDRLNAHDDAIGNSTSTDSKEVVTRRKPFNSVVVKSIISDNSEETTFNETPNESDGSSSHYNDIVSSSSSTNTEKTIFRQDTLIRFTSARPKDHSSYQETAVDNMFNESDESYPLHNSFVTSTPPGSERSSIRLETVVQSTLMDSNKSQLQQNIIANRNSDELDEIDSHFEAIISSTSSDSDETAEQREDVIKSKSLNLIKSDVRQIRTVYETSNDSD